MKYIKHAVAYLLTVILLVGLFPAARAYSNDSVISSISLNHASVNSSPAFSTTSVSPSSSRYITLYVPYSDPDSEQFDLVKDIVYTYDQTVYKSVVVSPAANTLKITQESDNSYVKLAVKFNLISEADGTTQSETDYYIRVLKTAKTVSAFSGVINQKLSIDTASVNLSSAISGNYIQNDGSALDHIVITGSDSEVGTLTFPLGLSFGSQIPVSALSDLLFNTSSCGIISYNIEAFDSSASVGKAVITFNVYSKPVISSDLTDTLYIGSTETFTAASFTNVCDLNSGTLSEIELTPMATTAGTWYVSGVEAAAGKMITLSASAIGTLYFKGTQIGTAEFTWNIKNEAGYADPDGNGVLGYGVLNVLAASLSLNSYVSTSGILKGSSITANASQFSYSPVKASMTFIKIASVPDAGDGYICLTSALAKNDTLGYPALASNTALKVGAIIPYSYLNCISIVTKSSATSSSISFTWTATADSTVTKASWASPASYSVNFKTAGFISYSTQKNVPVTLNSSDFSTQYSSSTGYTLSYVTFTLPTATSGKLFLNYSTATKTGTAVTATTKYYPSANPNISNLSFVPYTDYSGAVSISFNAYKSDGTYITGTVYMVISDNKGGTVSYTIDKNDFVRIDAADFTKAFQDSTGKMLSYVNFTLPSTAYGKLYYDYISSSNYDSAVTASTNYYVYSSQYLSYVTFVDGKNYTGTVVISYTGYASDGTGYSGKLIIFVNDSPAGIVSYTCNENGTVTLNGSDFSSEFIRVTGSVMSYLVLTLPAANTGVLYSDYSASTNTGTKVTASIKYRDGASPNISNITYVPAADFVGKAEIKYTVYTTAGTAYIGKLKISVGETSAGTVSLSTNQNTPIKFTGNSFSNAFYSNSGGVNLSYITITPPSSSYGSLYYNYNTSGTNSSVVSDTKYFISSTPYISNITFVPQTGYSGSVSISYTGYTADGSPYIGKILITVGGGDGVIYYSTTPENSLIFSSSDFVSAYYAVMGVDLSYVIFTPPSYTYGLLYYGYNILLSNSTLVSSSMKYYPSSYPNISNISFLPNSGFSGSFSIAYTAYGTTGASFTGIIIMNVTARDGGTVTYKTYNNSPLVLNSSDFNSAFQTKTGSNISYVKFSQPSTTSGQLFYKYVSPTNYNSYVNSGTLYYMSSAPLLSDVSFVPDSEYTGTVTIPYTIVAVSGLAYTGQLVINVNDPNSYPFSDVDENYNWAKTAIKYLYSNDIVVGSGDGLYKPSGNLTRGDFLLIIFRAFNLSASDSDNFSDVPAGSYYYDAIAAAKAMGITQGSGGKFNPNAPISRQDAMVIITRTLDITGNSIEDGSLADLSDYSDSDDIADYAQNSAAALVKAGIIKGSGSYLNPQKMISRAEMAVILYNVLNR